MMMLQRLLFLSTCHHAAEKGVADEEAEIVSFTENCKGNCPRNIIYSQRDGGYPVPRSAFALLEQAFDNPWVWWKGQSLELLTRPKPDFQTAIDQAKVQLRFKQPIAG